MLLAQGCVSSDVSADSKTKEEVVLALPTDAAVPTKILRAIWFPNANGFGSGAWSPLEHADGVLVVAGDKLWFMTWNDREHHYDAQKSVDVIAAEKVSIETLGTTSMLVVRAANQSSDAFELMQGGQLASDPKVTRELLDLIEDLRSRHPASEL
jgi:hypothetical protein